MLSHVLHVVPKWKIWSYRYSYHPHVQKWLLLLLVFVVSTVVCTFLIYTCSMQEMYRRKFYYQQFAQQIPLIHIYRWLHQMLWLFLIDIFREHWYTKDMCVCVCVCVCARARVCAHFHHSASILCYIHYTLMIHHNTIHTCTQRSTIMSVSYSRLPDDGPARPDRYRGAVVTLNCDKSACSWL
jgi:hypothetical protein